MTRPLNLFTIHSDADFLPALARTILAGGFPHETIAPPGPADLARWTILLPTRRAAREFERVLLDLSKAPALLLPRIRPIGDIDEDLLAPDDDRHEAELAPAIAPLAREFLLIGLIDDWARDNPLENLAAELRQAPAQALSLARSLAGLVDAFETEEADLDTLPLLFEGELAQHREAILGFLAIVRRRLPEELQNRGRLGPLQRRSALLRIEAERLREMPPSGPIIAAGSTGSIPATANLLKTIAGLEQGAVVLPGLDLVMDDESFAAVGPQHPQYALKRLIESWSLERHDIRPLAGASENIPRRWLASEIMRPTATAGEWSSVLTRDRARLAAGLQNIELVEARTRQQEAAAIGLLLRSVLEEPGKTAALVTPDRELARRVKAEMRRWSVEIDDSAGEPLIRSPQGSLLAALIDLMVSDFDAVKFAALLHHPLASFGLAPAAMREAASVFDLAVLRRGPLADGENRFARSLAKAREAIDDDPHTHGAIKRISAAGWASAEQLARHADMYLAIDRGDAPFAVHLDRLILCAKAVAPPLEDEEAGEALTAVLKMLRDAASYFPAGDISRAALAISSTLARTPVRVRRSRNERLSILGLLEARLISADVIVLGGLNEGTWPAQPDTGPWLNRPMRETLGLDMPERHIGVTAHDFIQSFSAPRLVLTWARRVGNDPAIPSRWLLRLQMLMKAASIPAAGGHWAAWAAQLDRAAGDAPVPMPKPTPPPAARPKRFSITEVEKLIRDPYGIYAKRVLRLEPLTPIAPTPDYSLRGQLFHAALGKFTEAFPGELPADAAERLVAIGYEVFKEHLANPDVAGFWWPRFKRVASWWVAEERILRSNSQRVFSEITVKYDFGGLILSGRADRVDILRDGSARIADFKTGTVPSPKQVETGLSPQLTLEAALLELGAFDGVEPASTNELLYIKLSGGEPPGEITQILHTKVMEISRKHLASFRGLVAQYEQQDRPYIPRHMIEKEEDETDYDQLSRWREWALAGDTP
ncbi:double-strand break repair protein AddB [soil metagenome]